MWLQPRIAPDCTWLFNILQAMRSDSEQSNQNEMKQHNTKKKDLIEPKDKNE